MKFRELFESEDKLDKLENILVDYILHNTEWDQKDDEELLTDCVEFIKKKHPEYNDLMKADGDGIVYQAWYRVKNDYGN